MMNKAQADRRAWETRRDPQTLSKLIQDIQRETAERCVEISEKDACCTSHRRSIAKIRREFGLEEPAAPAAGEVTQG